MNINDGNRPSRLELARRATGERQGDVPAEFQQELAAAKAQVRPFDWEVLSKHAARLDEPAAKHAPKQSRMWIWTLLPTLVAAVALFVLVPDVAQRTRNKGAFLIPHVSYHVQRGGDVFPGEQLSELREGDRVQFTVDPAGHPSFVLLSVDGTGKWTTYYPSSGERPTPLAPRPQELPESIELDAAPGPEVFVAFFGADELGEVKTIVEAAYAQGGTEGLLDLARSRDDVEVTVIRKE